MKSKRFLCTVLACVVMISCITNAAAIQEEVADDFVEYNTESILTTRAIGEFEMTVSAKTKAIADSSLSLEAGDTVRINASYSPDGSVDFGLVDEDGVFHYNWVSFHHTVESRHTDHFVCPFVINTSGLINDQLYAIGGDIWVNYTDTWS